MRPTVMWVSRMRDRGSNRGMATETPQCTALRVATAILAVLIGAGPAPAQWRDATETDSTGKKIVMQRTPAKGALSKSGREVTSNLYLRCDNPYDNRVKYRGHDYWSAFVLFSEPVSSVEARTRYSFDGGETTQSTFMFNQSGTALFFTQQEDEDNEFIKRLARSTTLQISPVLRWRGFRLSSSRPKAPRRRFSRFPATKNFNSSYGTPNSVQERPYHHGDLRKLMTVAIGYSLDVQCLGPPVADKLAYPLTDHRDSITRDTYLLGPSRWRASPHPFTTRLNSNLRHGRHTGRRVTQSKGAERWKSDWTH